MDSETTARLVSWEGKTRADAVAIDGETEIRRQEAWVAEYGVSA